jgi:hypothetical protein
MCYRDIKRQLGECMKRLATILALLIASPNTSGAQEAAPRSVAPPSREEIKLSEAPIPDYLRANFAALEGVGWKTLPETLKLAKAPVRAGEPLIDIEFQYARTGVIVGEYHSKPILTGSLTIPAGTLVYASSFSSTSPFAKIPFMRGWCAAAYVGPATKAGERGVCFFGQPDAQAVFYPVAKAQSPYAASSMDMRNFHMGPFPQIEERPFPSDLHLHYIIAVAKVANDKITLAIQRGDGVRMSNSLRQIQFNADGMAPLTALGGEFQIKRESDGRASVTLTKPLAPLDTTLHFRAYRTLEGTLVTARGVEYRINGESVEMRAGMSDGD